MVTLDSLIVQAASKKDPVVAVASAADREVLEALVLLLKKGLPHSCFSMMKSDINELIQTNFPHLLDDEKISIHHAEDDSRSSDAFSESGFKWTCTCPDERKLGNVHYS